MRSRCQFGIGEGQITKKEKLSILDCKLEELLGGGHTGDSFWNSLDSEDMKEKVDEEEKVQNDQSVSNLFLNCLFELHIFSGNASMFNSRLYKVVP